VSQVSPNRWTGHFLGPFILQEQTCDDCIGMSVSCQKRTHALQQTTSFNHLIGEGEQ
jgi:hypothetical protein